MSVVEHLRKTGMTLREIGRITETSESFVSRVATGKRNLTIDHLQKIEAHLHLPLPLLLLQAIPKTSLPESLRPLYEQAAELLTASAESRYPFCVTGTVKRKGQNEKTEQDEDRMVVVRSESRQRKVVAK